MSNVKAISRGFFGGKLRQVGDVFDCPSDAFSENWMEKIKGKPKKLAPEEPQIMAYNIPGFPGTEDKSEDE